MFGNCMRRPLGEDYARGWPAELDQKGKGPLVLFESPDGAEAHGVWKLLSRYGYRMTWCPGPKGGFSSSVPWRPRATARWSTRPMPW